MRPGHLIFQKHTRMGETLPIKVKWLKNKYDVNVMLDESVEVLKAQVRSPLHLFKKLE
jgi:hypothetical protein